MGSEDNVPLLPTTFGAITVPPFVLPPFVVVLELEPELPSLIAAVAGCIEFFKSLGLATESTDLDGTEPGLARKIAADFGATTFGDSIPWDTLIFGSVNPIVDFGKSIFVKSTLRCRVSMFGVVTAILAFGTPTLGVATVGCGTLVVGRSMLIVGLGTLTATFGLGTLIVGRGILGRGITITGFGISTAFTGLEVHPVIKIQRAKNPMAGRDKLRMATSLYQQPQKKEYSAKYPEITPRWDGLTNRQCFVTVDANPLIKDEHPRHFPQTTN